MKNVLAVILGGGTGTRLFPLTVNRSKPAVPIAGKYRLIDIPISNCLNSGVDKIAILTQFNSVSLHRHISTTYRRDIFTDGWVEILAAEQTPRSDGWYQGTADAVRQQLVEIKNARVEYVLILAGDHLYQMDYSKFIEFHIDTNSDITLAVQPVEERIASGLGILKRSKEGEIIDFKEKPSAEILPELASKPGENKPYMASMGIYVFSTDLLFELLNSPGDDFGRDIIPQAIYNFRVMGYVFDGYWADIGTIRRFYEVNLELASTNKPFSFKNPDNMIFTHPRYLPPTEIVNACLNDVLLTDGCQITECSITNSVIGLRSIIGKNVKINSSIIMGADYYETEDHLVKNKKRDRPNIGVADGVIIDSALIDKNARIGKNVHIKHIENRPDSDNKCWFVRDGLVIVPKNGMVPDNTII
ncbi:glucose-1-phosphate adenylyltransferase [Bacteroidota bacterium]